MKIAIPIENNQLCMHFGHCEKFAFFEIDDKNQSIQKRDDVTPPEHVPGLLPEWIKNQGVDVVLAGGIGMHAQQLFADMKIKVLAGIQETDPVQAITLYLQEKLTFGQNTCDH